MAQRCKFEKQNLKQCEAWSMTGSDFCFTHNPEMVAKKKEAVIKGGRSHKKNYNPLPAFEINGSKSVAELLSQTINEVRMGQIDLRVANCIGYLSGHLIKAIEVSNVQDTLNRIEQKLKQNDLKTQ